MTYKVNIISKNMCGIFLLIQKLTTDSPSVNLLHINKLFNSISKRGPDASNLLLKDNIIIGFHRLAINDLSDSGLQPFWDEDNENFLICNGEIYNHKFLEKKYNISTKSKSDCEFLLKLFTNQGIYNVISEIDGVFAIICRINKQYYFIRDRIGVRPLFYSENDDIIIASSEPISLQYDEKMNIKELPPSTILEIDEYGISTQPNKYYHIPKGINGEKDEKVVIENVRKLLINAVKKRMMSDREVGCLLSGGLDSSIVAAILSSEYKKLGKKLKTFSIGFPDSTDIIYARKVAQFIDSEHHEYIIEHKNACNKISKVIKDIGTYDITTVRASTMMWMLCEWISHKFKEKVLYSGEGSDEVFSGYLYFHLAPDSKSIEDESYRLVSNLYKYDVLRADRCISSHGLELREPFLDIDLIQYYMKLSGDIRKPKNGFEKWILRNAFSDMLPNDVVWRRKAAFSDAVSSAEKPWYVYIQDYVKNDQTISEIPVKFPTRESYYYYKKFKEHYPYYEPEIEYWLPKWSDTKDPSATTLKIFNKNEH